MLAVTPRQLNGVSLLAAQTSRSQAYIQALAARGLLPERVILLGTEPVMSPTHETPAAEWKGIFLPDLAEPITRTCERVGVPWVCVDESDVNTDAVAREIHDASPEVIIYSGAGGQIVSAHILDLGPRFLHLHSGWLPDYRGSTTLYYALLAREMPGVTALYLDSTIDTGPILARRHYPIPPATMDLDQVYDGAIRADLLVQLMDIYADTGKMPVEEGQDAAAGETYYVIHPVLKHLALLMLQKGTGC